MFHKFIYCHNHVEKIEYAHVDQNKKQLRMARQGYLLSFEAEPHLPLILKDNYQTKKRKKEQENKKEKKK